MAKRAARKSKPAKSGAKAKAKGKDKAGKPAKKVMAKAKPTARKAVSRSAAKVKAAVKSKAKTAAKKVGKAAARVAKAATKPGAARRAGQTVRRKMVEAGQAINDKTSSIAESVTGGVALATGIIVGTVEAILPPGESAEHQPHTPELAANESLDDDDDLDEAGMEGDDLAEIE
jgi:predicted DsbA family dithiol-disulfide isomerase